MMFSHRQQLMHTGLVCTSGVTRWQIRSTRAPCGRLPKKFMVWRRHYVSFVDLPTVLVPPAVFTGLLASLWVYKCCMMVIFQNKIIYMPSISPYSRSEKIETYRHQCHPVEWREHCIAAPDGTKISLVVSSMALTSEVNMRATSPKRVVILYFQGSDSLAANFHDGADIRSNGSSLPPRLPSLSRIVEKLNSPVVNGSTAVDYIVVALSYRGYWTSQGRPSQKGIEIDALAATDWVFRKFGTTDYGVKVVLWGQSLGAGVATFTASRYQPGETLGKSLSGRLAIDGLLLETPFLGLRQMVTSLYPQRWLPYRYLWPFLRSRWDSVDALRMIASSKVSHQPEILILQAGKDEVVPLSHGLELEELCRKHGLTVSRCEVPGALHTGVLSKELGRRAIITFIRNYGRDGAYSRGAETDVNRLKRL